jgi:hypothetical protein
VVSAEAICAGLAHVSFEHVGVGFGEVDDDQTVEHVLELTVHAEI